MLGVGFKDEDVMDIITRATIAATKGTSHNDGHHPHHAEEDTDTAAFGMSDVMSMQKDSER